MIELMVTLAIASILMTIAAPNLVSTYQQYSVTGQANEMINALNYARSEAIRRNAPVNFCRTTSETSTECATSTSTWDYWLIKINNNVISRGAVKYQAGLEQTSNITSLTFGADGLAYNGSSLLSNSYIQIQAGSQIRCIGLQAGIRTKVSTPDTTNANSTGAVCSYE